MQIWEAETLHMSQLAGGWDFLDSFWLGMCFKKKKEKKIVLQTLVLQPVPEVQPLRAGLGGTDGQKGRRSCRKLPGSCGIRRGGWRSLPG